VWLASGNCCSLLWKPCEWCLSVLFFEVKCISERPVGWCGRPALYISFYGRRGRSDEWFSWTSPLIGNSPFTWFVRTYGNKILCEVWSDLCIEWRLRAFLIGPMRLQGWEVAWLDQGFEAPDDSGFRYELMYGRSNKPLFESWASLSKFGIRVVCLFDSFEYDRWCW